MSSLRRTGSARRSGSRIGSHRIQMKFAGGCLIIAEATRERGLTSEGGSVAGRAHSVMIRVADADRLCERARQHGTHILKAPTDCPYGERQCNLEDPSAIAGH